MRLPGSALLAAAVLSALVALPGAAAAVTGFDQDVGMQSGERRSWPVQGAAGDELSISWDATAAVDVALVEGNASAWDNGTTSPLFLALDRAAGQGHVTLAGAGPWTFLLDNSPEPAGGANGSAPVTAHVQVAPVVAEPPATQPPAGGSEDVGTSEAPTLWNTLLFDAPSWSPGGVVAFSSVALWMVLFLAASLYGWSSPATKAAVLLAYATAFTVAWALIPHPGTMVEVGLPMLAGVGLGWLAVRASRRLPDAARLAFAPAVLGAFAGTAVAYGLHALWASAGTMTFGSGGFADVVFTLPASALLGVVLFKLIPDVVHAFEDANADEAQETVTTPGQEQTFLVTCLRCGTEIKVDRSMKRFRVATDRFEFACPNCQYWMEWVDPRAAGAAAA